MRKHAQDTRSGYKFGDHLLLAPGCLLKYQTPHIEMIEMIKSTHLILISFSVYSFVRIITVIEAGFIRFFL